MAMFKKLTNRLTRNMSPLRKRQLARFRNNRMAFISLILFSIIFVLSMSAEFIANDKPIMVRYNGNTYFPIVKSYPETTFGGVFETETMYLDPEVQNMIDEKGFAIWPLIPFADQTPSYGLAEAFPAPPNKNNWLGTDDQGRDVLTRILYGFRISILFGLGLTIVTSIIGVIVGALQGYFGGWVDLIGQRIVEVWAGLPTIFMIIILVSVFSPTVWWLFAIMAAFGWLGLVGLVRAEFLRARNFDYVRAARAMGSSHSTIIFKHILPNALASSLSQLPFILSANIIALTSLDYIGYGLPPGSPSLGELVKQGQVNLDAPWLVLSAFFSLTFLLSLLIFIGDGLRDAFDPRKV